MAEGPHGRVGELIHAYRAWGHLAACIDPLGQPPPLPPQLEPGSYGFSPEDIDAPVFHQNGQHTETLRGLLERLRRSYCGPVGAEFMHIADSAVREWLQERLEQADRPKLSRSEQLRILTLLTEACVFESFVAKRYVGAKTFSLEGSESLIPLLALAVERAATHGVDDVVLGMAHRGRLNVLVNVLNKTKEEMFREFEGGPVPDHAPRGDVKYHLGYSSQWECPDGRGVHLSLCFNPSHLEFIDPVAVGRVRGRQDRVGDEQRARVLGLLIHGDAGFAGEGVVQETLNLAALPAYRTGGTLHVIVNNQLGFTTSPAEGRSSMYATGVAKMLDVPIFHVNGEDPEAVRHVAHVAMDFRARFRRDVIIDLYGYRRHGHNETDEPAFTQPLLYEAIRKRESVREAYVERLIHLGGITREEADAIEALFREELEQGLTAARSEKSDATHAALAPRSRGVWRGYSGGREPDDEPITGVPRERLAKLLQRCSEVPEGFSIHPRLGKAMHTWREMAAGRRPLNWSAAETLCYAALAAEGVPIRLSGQDTARGTFSHRHAVLHDVRTGDTYMPLSNLSPTQGTVEIWNSPLSEAGALGFEYGYSLDRPATLTLWEAQFGDFSNAAQVYIDQFLASAEEKWGWLSGLVLLLPHGFEGQGPEHSSARLERFLQLAVADNIQVVVPTTPAQFFHCLRRQARRTWRKPLVIFTPKSLLRHRRVVSDLDELAKGAFARVIPDELEPSGIRRILLCSGKVYYDLLAAREESKREDVAIVRVEQLYPLPDRFLDQALSQYAAETPACWVQEEPKNMGAWCHLHMRFAGRLLDKFPLECIARPPAASPATGSSAMHKYEQAKLLQEAVG